MSDSPAGSLALPDSLRSAFKEPLGPVYAETDDLLAAIRSTADEHDARPLVIAVGDVVTHHLLEAGTYPDVAIVDYRTERDDVDPAVAATLEAATDDLETFDVENPAATISFEALEAIRAAIDRAEPVVVEVDGEEDLLSLPAIVAAPIGASVVYGQPGRGMVHVGVTDEVRADARELFSRLEGETAAALDRLE